MLKFLLDPCTIVRVQSWDSEIRVPSTVEQALGATWPQDMGTIANGRADILCVGPADWLVMTTELDGTALVQRLNEAFEQTTFCATNVSQGLARIEVGGPEVRVLLNKGCALDLHPSRFAPGRCVRTRFAGMPLVIRCTRPFAFECIVALSYQHYLLSWLNDATVEF
jgi:sarcosine oxidase, subunit gamma